MSANVWFITGATGSLGREILPRVAAADPKAEMVLLVRGADDDAVEARVAELDRFVRNYWSGSIRGQVTPLRGDVALPRLGLEPRAYESLARRVTHIVHAAATIRLNAPEDEARRINVGGTREVLRLAGCAPRLSRLAHVSTAYVAGDRTGRILECELRQGQRFLNSYEASKCEAEELVRRCMGYLPVTVFRPSIIVGDSADGHTCNFSTIYYPLRKIAQGCVEEIPGPPEAPIDLIPVDHVARCIVELAIEPRRRSETYHIAAGPERCVPVRELVEAARRLNGCAGLPQLHFVPVPRADAPRTRPLAAHFTYLGYPKAFDDTALARDLGDAGRPDPRTYLARVLDFCRDTDWGARLPWEPRPCATPSLN